MSKEFLTEYLCIEDCCRSKASGGVVYYDLDDIAYKAGEIYKLESLSISIFMLSQEKFVELPEGYDDKYLMKMALKYGTMVGTHVR